MQPGPKSPEPLELLRGTGLYLDSEPELQPAAQGLVNRVFLTPEYVVRISKSGGSNHPRECQIAEHLLKLGVQTARPIAWDQDYSIWQRLPGVSLHEWGEAPSAYWDEVFADLEIVHSSQPLAEEKPSHWRAEFVSSLEATREQWNSSEYKLLKQIETQPHLLQNPVFVHGDLFPANLMVGPDGSYTGMLDWGCAGYLGLERELSRLEPISFGLALQRWGKKLDLELVYKQRIDLLLVMARYERVGLDVVREALAAWQKVAL